MIELVGFDDFTGRIPGVTRRTLLRMCSRGQFPPYIRFSPNSEPRWSLTEVERWLAAKLGSIASQ